MSSAALLLKLIDVTLVIYEGIQAGNTSVGRLLELRDVAARGDLTDEYLNQLVSEARTSVDAYAKAVKE